MAEYKVIECDNLQAFEDELNCWAQDGYIIGICEHDSFGRWWAIMERSDEL